MNTFYYESKFKMKKKNLGGGGLWGAWGREVGRRGCQSK